MYSFFSFLDYKESISRQSLQLQNTHPGFIFNCVWGEMSLRQRSVLRLSKHASELQYDHVTYKKSSNIGMNMERLPITTATTDLQQEIQY